MYSNLVIRDDKDVLRVVISRKKCHNAINMETIGELDDLVNRVRHNRELKCLILRGVGDEAFVSGGDIKELRGLRSHEDALDLNRRMGSVLRRIELMDCVVIVAINGLAIGGGAELTLVGDRRLMAREARICFRQAVLGLTCGWGGMTRLINLVGRSAAFRILLLEEEISAELALELGLVDEVLPRSELDSRCEDMARRLTSLPPLALKAAKRGLARLGDLPFERALEYEAELFARSWASEDHWEALDAFFSSRRPSFRGN